MKSLFFRILALLLGCSLVVVLISFLLFHWIDRELEPGGERVRSMIREAAQELVHDYHDGDIERAISRLDRFNVRAWIEDDRGRPLTHPGVPPGIRNQIREYPQIIYPHQNQTGHFIVYTEPVELDGQRYHVIMTTTRLGIHRQGRFEYLWIPLLGMLVLGLAVGSAAIGYWILQPLRAFRDTAGSISADNLGARLPDHITSRRDTFGDLAREFNGMTERLEQSVQSHNQLLRDVSHELRSPLNRIQVAASLWARKSGDTEACLRIENEVGRLDRMIEDLLSLSRLKSGVALEPVAMELMATLRAVSDDAGFEFSPEGKTVSVQGPGTARCSGDAPLLMSALENVVRNALKHSPPGGNVKITLKHVYSNYSIDVRDHGTGVDPDKLHRIFDPFYRADEARSTGNGHHGIGLALAKAIIELHRGSIHAFNEDGGGLTVTISLPAG